jgi:hypothetical protein
VSTPPPIPRLKRSGDADAVEVNNIGPQVRFPVPEGIWNYNGSNYLALTIWGMEKGGVKLGGLQLSADAAVQSGYVKPGLVEGERYAQRLNSY